MQNPKPKPNKVTISQKITVDTFYCEDDFETEQEWEEFRDKIINSSQEELGDILCDDVDKEDLGSALRNTKHKIRIKLDHYDTL